MTFKIVIMLLAAIAAHAAEKKESKNSAERLVELEKARAAEIEAANAWKKAREKRKKLSSPAEKQAINEREKQERDTKKYVEAGYRAHVQAKIEGCGDKSGQVWVNPALGHHKVLGLFIPSYVSVRVVNEGPNPIDIDSTEAHLGKVIGGLCAGGRATLVRQYRPGWDPDYVTGAFVAYDHNNSGSTQQGPSYSLYGNQNTNYTYSWTINVRR